MKKEITRGYKVRLYPNSEQEQKLLQIVGASRFVYNYFLEKKKMAYSDGKKNLSFATLSRDLTKLRKETEWLRPIQLQPLQQSLRSLDVAYNRFFKKHSNFPKFHTKYGRQSFRRANSWSIKGNFLKIEENLTIRFRGNFPVKRQGTLTISRDAVGDWYASTLSTEAIKQPRLKKRGIGLDLGLKHIVITSEGEKYENSRVLNGFERRIKSASQALSRTDKGSKNNAKKRLILAKTHRKVERVRTNGLHHISRSIVDKNHAMIAVEDLAIKNMVKNRRLSRSISDVSWGELLRQITYKQEWIGGRVVRIGRFFPSSKTCSACNFIIGTLPLSIREWTCPRCEVKHDRDINAAKMILKQAEEQLVSVESTDGIRSLRRSERVTGSVKRGYVQT